jgi:V8-like Glu-specific endopeptidase
LIKQNDYFLWYETNTSKGQSGSPVFYKHENICYVVGIHVYGSQSSKRNQAIALTRSKLTKIHNWIREMSVPNISMFTLNQNGAEQILQL